MFEAAELGHQLTKEEYAAKVPELRTQLLQVQTALRGADFPVLIVLDGVDGAGKGEVANLLCEWMDPRFIQTHAFAEPTDEERERPDQWRYWRLLPARGRVGLYFGAWYTRPIHDRAFGVGKKVPLESTLARINAFERMIADEGALILKFWFHLSKADQKRRFRALEKKKGTRWRVTDADWEHHAQYDRLRKTAERVIGATSTGEAPWTIVDASDARHRNVTVAQHIVDRVTRKLTLSKERLERKQAPRAEAPREDPTTLLDKLDLAKALSKDEYERALEEGQLEVAQLCRRAYDKGQSAILVFEGWDAAGKGGAIRRITHAMDARQYQVVPIAAPSDEERAHHYLWRFWRHLPRGGRVTIFDRSWYGRVLVERIEGFASDNDWQRGYSEINHFEEQLTDHGILVLKYWLHISKDEQLRRFEERQGIAFKQYKVTDEDFRNRAKWENYEAAAAEMIQRTSTQRAPWLLVEANDKRYARIQVLRTFCEQLRAAL